MIQATEQDTSTTLGKDYHVFREDGQMLFFGIERSQVIRISDPKLFEVLEQFERQDAVKAIEPEDLVADQDWPEGDKRQVIDQLRAISRHTRYTYPLDPHRNDLSVRDVARITPASLTLILSEACNLRCRYCYTGLQTDKYSSKLMSQDVARRAIDLLMKHLRPGAAPGLLFFGGEPLLNMPVLRFSVDYLREKATERGLPCRFGITTNGVLLTQDILHFLMENQVTLTLSLDGPAEVHDRHRILPDGSGSHAAVLRALRMIQEHNYPFDVRATDPGDTGMTHAELARYFHELGVSSFQIAPVMRTGDNARDVTEQLGACDKRRVQDEALRELYESVMSGDDKPVYDTLSPTFSCFLDGTLRAPRRSCGVGRSETAVGADGTLYPCHRFWPRSEYALGDVFQGFDLARYNRVFGGYHQQVLVHCESCWIRYECQGACMRFRVPLDGDSGNFVPPSERDCQAMRRGWERSAALFVRAMREHPDRVKALVKRPAAAPLAASGDEES